MGRTSADDGREVFAAVLPERIDGGDFVLRHAREDDVEAIRALVDDEMRLRLMLPDVIEPAMTRLMVLHGGALLIVDPATDEPIGGLRLFLHGDVVEFGYWLGVPARGRGLATRALELAIDTIGPRLDPAGYELRTTVGNEPSERVAARAGFTRIGPEPQLEYPGGRIVETVLWTR